MHEFQPFLATSGMMYHVFMKAVIVLVALALIALAYAQLSALARVGPGVTVPGNMRVLPGANVTTNAEASTPALGKVVPITAADSTASANQVLQHQALAAHA